MQTLDTFVLSCLLAFMAYFVLLHEIAKCERHQKASDACGCALHPIQTVFRGDRRPV